MLASVLCEGDDFDFGVFTPGFGGALFKLGGYLVAEPVGAALSTDGGGDMSDNEDAGTEFDGEGGLAGATSPAAEGAGFCFGRVHRFFLVRKSRSKWSSSGSYAVILRENCFLPIHLNHSLALDT